MSAKSIRAKEPDLNRRFNARKIIPGRNGGKERFFDPFLVSSEISKNFEKIYFLPDLKTKWGYGLEINPR